MGRAAMPSITDGYHIALRVSHANRSAEWYCSPLNMPWQEELSSRGITFTPITEDGH